MSCPDQHHPVSNGKDGRREVWATARHHELLFKKNGAIEQFEDEGGVNPDVLLEQRQLKDLEEKLKGNSC